MSGSPKQDVRIIFDDDEGWPLVEPPVLSFSPAHSEEDVSSTMPSTPRQSVVLPGFHFSTTDENVDPLDFHRTAAQLLTGEAPSKRHSGLTDENAQLDMNRQLHCDLGKDPSSRFCCSCGKSYTTSLRLREHVRKCAGATNFPCTICEKIFDIRTKLDRHVATRHNTDRERPAIGPTPEIDETYQRSSRKSVSQHYWIYDGDLSWCPGRSKARDSMVEEDEEEDKGNDMVEQTISFIKQLLRRPTSQQPMKKSCDICGELFDADGNELALHIGQHSLDFAEKRHKCHDCHIFFANEKDLERHLQSADLNHHCGFTFRHNAGTCTGHHPPTYYKSSLTNDHDLMQRHLWSWELCQLRTHRLAIASVLAERLNRSTGSSMSLQNARRTYASLLPHFNIASRDSITTSVRDSDVNNRLSSLISEILPADDVDVEQDRPDSAILTPRDLPKRRIILDAFRQGHKRAQSGPVTEAIREGLMKHRSLPVQHGAVVRLVA